MRLRLLLAGLLLSAAGTSTALPDADADFWAWLAPQLTFSEFQHPDIDRWEARYRRRHLELQVILNRGKEFLYPLALAVRDRGMPLEIALLPVIESHLDPTAESASGARGLWQLLPATAEHLGLRHDWWHDESADFARSTAVALDYLDYLHDRFGGWLLGLAAYNAGEGRVYKEMRQRGERGQSRDYWDLDLRAETRNYVPKLLGLARVLREPGPLRLPEIKTRRSFVQVDTGGPLDITQIADLSGVSIEHVYRLNPQLLRWATPPDGSHRIYLPIEARRRFTAALRSFDPELRRRWRRHRVRRGETLSEIARDFGTTVSLIRRINGLSDQAIRPDDWLILADHDRGLTRLTLAAAGRGKRLSYAQRALPVGYHEVADGDSLWSIARHYGTTVAKIRQQNRLPVGQGLIPGQLLQIGEADDRQRIFYEVQPGDMLSLIAERYEVTVRQIRRWNGIDGSLLRPGQTLELRLPASTS